MSHRPTASDVLLNLGMLAYCPVPIRCVTKEEYDTLMLVGDEICTLTKEAALRDSDHRQLLSEIEAHGQQRHEAMAWAGIHYLGRLMNNVMAANPTHSPDQIALLVHTLISFEANQNPGFTQMVATSSFISDDMWAEKGSKVKYFFKQGLDVSRETLLTFNDDTQVVSSVCREVMDLSDIEAGIFFQGSNIGLVVEEMGVPAENIWSHLITPEQTLEAKRLSSLQLEEHREFWNSLPSKLEEFERANRVVAGRLVELASLIPQTGEAKAYAELVSAVALSIGSADRINAPDVIIPLVHTNHLLARASVYVATLDMDWEISGRKALAALLSSPKKFSQYRPTDEAGEQTKNCLRELRDDFCGPRPQAEQDQLVQVLLDPAYDEIDAKWYLADFLAAKNGRDRGVDTMPKIASKAHHFLQGGIFSRSDASPKLLFLTIFNPGEAIVGLKSKDEIELERMLAEEEAVQQKRRLADEAEFEKALAEEEALAASITPPAPAPFASSNRRKQVAAASSPVLSVAVERKLSVIYVSNPQSKTPRMFTRECLESALEENLTVIFEDNVETTEPASSLARAVTTYALHRTPEQRQVMNKEQAGGFVFHKLKRGRARIYVRIDGDSLYVHAYNRREWDKPIKRDSSSNRRS